MTFQQTMTPTIYYHLSYHLCNAQVGIIPTDTLPAIVCDMSSRTAVQRMYAVKQMNEKKPLSILVRGFSDISTYTMGFPTSHEAGQPDYFKLFKKLLPGAYTIILPASKALPVQNVDMAKGKNIQRKSVRVRWADDKICQVSESADTTLFGRPKNQLWNSVSRCKLGFGPRRVLIYYVWCCKDLARTCQVQNERDSGGKRQGNQ